VGSGFVQQADRCSPGIRGARWIEPPGGFRPAAGPQGDALRREQCHRLACPLLKPPHALQMISALGDRERSGSRQRRSPRQKRPRMERMFAAPGSARPGLVYRSPTGVSRRARLFADPAERDCTSPWLLYPMAQAAISVSCRRVFPEQADTTSPASSENEMPRSTSEPCLWSSAHR